MSGFQYYGKVHQTRKQDESSCLLHGNTEYNSHYQHTVTAPGVLHHIATPPPRSFGLNFDFARDTRDLNCNTNIDNNNINIQNEDKNVDVNIKSNHRNENDLYLKNASYGATDNELRSHLIPISNMDRTKSIVLNPQPEPAVGSIQSLDSIRGVDGIGCINNNNNNNHNNGRNATMSSTYRYHDTNSSILNDDMHCYKKGQSEIFHNKSMKFLYQDSDDENINNTNINTRATTKSNYYNSKKQKNGENLVNDLNGINCDYFSTMIGTTSNDQMYDNDNGHGHHDSLKNDYDTKQQSGTEFESRYSVSTSGTNKSRSRRTQTLMTTSSDSDSDSDWESDNASETSSLSGKTVPMATPKPIDLLVDLDLHVNNEMTNFMRAQERLRQRKQQRQEQRERESEQKKQIQFKLQHQQQWNLSNLSHDRTRRVTKANDTDGKHSKHKDRHKHHQHEHEHKHKLRQKHRYTKDIIIRNEYVFYDNNNNNNNDNSTEMNDKRPNQRGRANSGDFNDGTADVDDDLKISKSSKLKQTPNKKMRRSHSVSSFATTQSTVKGFRKNKNNKNNKRLNQTKRNGDSYGVPPQTNWHKNINTMSHTTSSGSSSSNTSGETTPRTSTTTTRIANKRKTDGEGSSVNCNSENQQHRKEKFQRLSDIARNRSIVLIPSSDMDDDDYSDNNDKNLNRETKDNRKRKRQRQSKYQTPPKTSKSGTKTHRQSEKISTTKKKCKKRSLFDKISHNIGMRKSGSVSSFSKFFTAAANGGNGAYHTDNDKCEVEDEDENENEKEKLRRIKRWQQFERSPVSSSSSSSSSRGFGLDRSNKYFNINISTPTHHSHAIATPYDFTDDLTSLNSKSMAILDDYCHKFGEKRKTIEFYNQSSLYYHLHQSRILLRKPKGISNDKSMILNIVTNMIGMGLLLIPWAVKNIGLIPSIPLLFISFVLSFIAALMLALCSEYLNVYDYRSLFKVTFGEKFAKLIDLLLFCYSLFICVLYVSFLCDFMIDGLNLFHAINLKDRDSQIGSNGHQYTAGGADKFKFKHGHDDNNDDILIGGSERSHNLFEAIVTSRAFIQTIIVFGVLLPLTLCTKNLYALRYSSVIGLFGGIYTVALFTFMFFGYQDKREHLVNPSVEMINFHKNNRGNPSDYYGLYWFASFSCFVSASRCHFNVPNYYVELKNRNLYHFAVPLLISFVIVMCLTFICAFCVYLTFGEEIAPNILDSLHDNDATSAVARIMMSIVLIATYPLIFFPIKRSLKTLVFEQDNRRKRLIFLQHPMLKSFLFAFVTFIIFIVSIIYNYPIRIITFVNAILGIPITFIFPSLMYIRIFNTDKVISRYMHNTGEDNYIRSLMSTFDFNDTSYMDDVTMTSFHFNHRGNGNGNGNINGNATGKYEGNNKKYDLKRNLDFENLVKSKKHRNANRSKKKQKTKTQTHKKRKTKKKRKRTTPNVYNRQDSIEINVDNRMNTSNRDAARSKPWYQLFSLFNNNKRSSDTTCANNQSESWIGKSANRNSSNRMISKSKNESGNMYPFHPSHNANCSKIMNYVSYFFVIMGIVVALTGGVADVFSFMGYP